jgi:PASTA domain
MLIAQTPTPTTTTVPATTSAGVAHLSSTDWIVAVSLTVFLVLAAGLVVAVARTKLEGQPEPAGADGHTHPSRPPDKTLIRSWLAISLAGGLLLFCAISFGLDDTTLRSTLIGGLVANAGAAVAFYFASRASDQARHDILTASFPSVLVPNLVGKKESEVNSIMATTSLHLVSRPPDRNKDAATVVFQNPTANQAVPQSSQISAEFAGPVPDTSGMTPADADAALKRVNLVLVKDPQDAADTATAKSQLPTPGSDAPQDKNVTVTFA